MGIRPYYICQCGQYHDVVTKKCSKCNTDLKNIEIVELELNQIPLDKQGQIDPLLKIYVQICPDCNKANYSSDGNLNKCRYCPCYISDQPVLEYDEYLEKKNSPKKKKKSDSSNANVSSFFSLKSKIEASLPEEDREKEDEKRKALSLKLESMEPYTGFEYSIHPEDVMVLLGRGAACRDFLEKDSRISSEHCYLIFRDNRWYVHDVSQTSTQINDEIIEKGKDYPLRTDVVLRLGGWSDSISFKVEYI